MKLSSNQYEKDFLQGVLKNFVENPAETTEKLTWLTQAIPSLIGSIANVEKVPFELLWGAFVSDLHRKAYKLRMLELGYIEKEEESKEGVKE